jgi:PAS domain S-box-containing protein
MSGTALVGTQFGVGPYADADPHQSLLRLQAFLGTIAATTLVLASVISERQRAQQRLEVQEAVSRVLAESPTLREAVSKVVQVLCERARWDLGALWNIDRSTDELICVEVWHMPTVQAPHFVADTRGRRYASGVGLPGRVWRAGQAAWIPDVTTDNNFPRAPRAVIDGLHGAFGFPIKLGDETLGVIECISREVREPDDYFLQTVSDIGRQLGQFMERKRVENEIAALNERLAADLAAMTRLQQLSTRLVQTDDAGSLLQNILDVGIEITGAEMGNVQLFEPGSTVLKTVAQRGFENSLLDILDAIHNGSAVRQNGLPPGEKLIVGDLCNPETSIDNPAYEAMASAGVRALQSTPLVSRSGRLVGRISTHYRQPHRPTDRQLTLLDLLARQAADFIERAQTENRLLQSEERLHAVVDTAVDGIITINHRGTIITVNPAAERVFGYPAREMVGENVRMLMAEPYQSEHESYIGNYLRTGDRKIIGIGREVVGRRKNGETFPLDLAVSETRIADQHIFIGIVRDISERKRADELLRSAKDELVRTNEELERRVQERTSDLEQAHSALLSNIAEQKKLEEQLRHAQKMESIGTLAGGIAHDFNNILNIIRGYATLIGQQPSAQQQIRESLKVIDQEIDRGASVVRQLLTMARKTETQLAPTLLNNIVLTLRDLIKTFPKTITVALDLDPRPALVAADANKLSQALLNICVNARDAMPAGGQLTIRMKIIAGDTLRDRYVDAAVDEWVCVAISDTGMGMGKEVRARIFEPFFTTKGIGEGKGTGLGLAIVYGIVNEHNGFIEVDSQVGHGTTFRLYLPMLQSQEIPPIEAPTPAQASGQTYPNRRGTVLVVEDEKDLVRLLKRLLPQAGYHVLAAMDGKEAIDLYRNHHAEIDAVLLDLGLPKVTGLDVIPKLKEQNPAVRIIIATGYLEPELKAELFRSGVMDCVHKPYSINDLLGKLEATIESSRAPVN